MYFSFQGGAAVGLFLPRSMTCASGLPALDGNGCGQPLYLLIGASRKCVGGPVSTATTLGGPTRRHGQSGVDLLLFDGRFMPCVVSDCVISTTLLADGGMHLLACVLVY